MVEPDAKPVPAMCVRCGSARTVAGTVLAEGEVRFRPHGLRWWKLHGGVPLIPQSVEGCLDCGCLTGDVDPGQLRATIERAGGDELRAALERPGPGASSGSRG